MATILDKTITRDSGNIINTNTNYSELNTKASGLVNDIVSHVETQIQTTETALQASENLVDAKISQLLSVGDTGYTKDVVDTNFANQINALAPYSGYMKVSKKLDNFVFKEDANFTYSVADKNRFVKFGDKVVDTYGPELVDNRTFDNNTDGYSLGTDWSYDPINQRVYRTGTTYHNLLFSSYSKFVIGKTYSFKFEKGGSGSIGYYTNAGIYFNSSIGENEVVFKYTGGNYPFFYSSTNDGWLDNISVKEIQTADFSNDIPEVAEIITDGSNTTSVAVSAGDYVVDGSELVTNGTFDTDTSGWSSNTTLTWDNGRAKMVSTANQATWQGFATTIGKEYTVSFVGEGFSNVYISTSTSSAGSIYSFGYFTRTNEIETVTFTATASNMYFVFYNLGAVTCYIDNISVRRVSDTFRAKQDAPIGTALTDTTYFEDRTEIGVTNQVLSYHAYNTLTSAYEGIKTEVLFSDVSKEDLLDNSVWMARNGFSKVSEFLYSKGSYLVVPVGIWQSLNKGAYHPFLNYFGTAKFGGDGSLNYRYIWYTNMGTYPPLGLMSNSLADTFINRTTSITGKGGIGYESARPDSKYYDIIYKDQFIDLRQYAKIANKYEIELLREDKIENGVEEMVSTLISGQFILNGNWGSTAGGLDTNQALDFDELSYIPEVNLTGKYLTIVVQSNEGFIVGATFKSDGTIFVNKGAHTWTNGNSYIVSYVSTKPILSSNTKLSIDLIGNPDNYPQVLKDRLASGVGVVGVNPLLVDDEGNSLIPDGVTSFEIKGSDKMLLNLGSVKTTDGEAWSASAGVPNYISNVYYDGGGIEPLSQFRLWSYTSKNKPYIQCDPKQVLEVTPKAIASNSHSIYKGALIGNQVAGKIQVGNGANGYEGKVLENSDIVATKDLDSAVNASAWLYAEDKRALSLKVGDTVYVDGIDRTVATTPYYEYSTVFNKDVYRFTITETITPSLGASIVFALSTPTHSTIALDNANSPASKYFNVLETDDNHNLYAGVYGKEMIWDYSVDTGIEFTDYDPTTTLAETTTGTHYHIVSGEAVGYWLCEYGGYTAGSLDSKIVDGTFYFNDKNQIVVASNGDVVFTRWDGNGFGDNDEFDQLTNGTDTDLNGNTIKTFHGSIPLNIRRA